MGTDVTDLGSRKHLFIDLSLADQTSGVALGVNPPRLGGIAIGRDRAWEHHIHFQNTVLDDNGLGRCWYTRVRDPTAGLESARFGYAESEDGRLLAQTQPRDWVELNGRRDMNLIPPKPKRTNVFIDPTAPPPERYKTFGLSLDDDPGSDWLRRLCLARRLSSSRNSDATASGGQAIPRTWPSGTTGSDAMWRTSADSQNTRMVDCGARWLAGRPTT